MSSPNSSTKPGVNPTALHVRPGGKRYDAVLPMGSNDKSRLPAVTV